MATTNLDAADLSAVAFGGLIRESVMDQIFDISNYPLPFTMMVGKGTATNPRHEWTTDELADPDLTNAVVDGADQTQNDTATGSRVSNFCQTSTKAVQVSTRARNTNNIGRSDELSYQVERRQIELRRDVEATALSVQASQADDGNTTPGLSGGLSAWLTTNVVTGGTDGGFNTSTGVVDAYTPGAAAVQGTETNLKNIVQQIYEEGGDPTVLMSVPGVIRGLNEYLFSSSARIATLNAETSADSTSTGLKAQGSINVWVADHGQVLELHPNRIQRTYLATATPVADMFILDPGYLQMAYLYGYRVEPLAKTGLADKRLMAVDWTLCVLSEKAHGKISELDPTAAWAA